VLNEDDTTGAVLTVEDVDGRYVFNPAATRTLAAGDVLIAVGSAVQLEHLATATTPRLTGTQVRPVQRTQGTRDG
jgi:K+/H+ antiporter YhaU regulatory subunit KhtT